MIQYISWKQVNVMGNMTRLYLSMSDAVIPHIRFTSFMSHSGFGGGGAGGAGGGGQGGKSEGGGPSGGASSSYRPIGRPIPNLWPGCGYPRLMVFSLEPPLQCILGSWTLKWTVCGKKDLSLSGNKTYEEFRERDNTAKNNLGGVTGFCSRRQLFSPWHFFPEIFHYVEENVEKVRRCRKANLLEIEKWGQSSKEYWATISPLWFLRRLQAKLKLSNQCKITLQGSMIFIRLTPGDWWQKWCQ